MNNNKLINEKLICAFRWSVLSSNTGKGLAQKWPEPSGRRGTEQGAGQSTETSCEG